jgi:secreted trypsin-like serine protease
MRTLARFVAAAGAAAALALGAATPAGAVADGLDATAGMYPFAVKFTMTHIPRPDGTFYDSACSGSLIAAQWVITAGHCFHDVNRVPVSGPVPYATTATFGKVDVSDPGGYVVNVVEVRQAGVNDVALAKLATPVYGAPTLQVTNTSPTVGQQLTLAGWGALNSTNPAPNTHLRYGTVAVSSVNQYTVGVHGVYPAADTSACSYDSGAPYFVGGTLYSVESGGPDCPQSGEETTSRVDVIAPWITAQILGSWYQHY